MFDPSARYETSNANLNRTPVYRIRLSVNTSPVSTVEFSNLPIRANYDDVILADEPSVYYRLGELVTSPITTQATDSSGNAKHGTYQNAPTLGVTGALVKDSNTAVTFNGINQKVTVPDDPLLDPGDTFSLELWFNFTDKGGGATERVHTLLDKGPGGYGLLLNEDLFATTAEVLLVKQGSPGFDVIAGSGPGSVASGVWYHLVVTKDGPTFIYLNGDDVTVPYGAETIVATAQELNIGGSNTTTDPTAAQYFKGTLDEVKIYPTVLSIADARAHRDAGRMLLNKSGVYPYLRNLSGLTSQIDPVHGTSSVGSLSFTIDDVDGVFTALLADGVLNMSATLDCGFSDIREDDYATNFYVGVLDKQKLTADLAGYECTLRSAAIRTNRQVFTPAKIRLRALMAAGLTSTVEVDDARAIEDSGYFLIEDEVISYSSKAADGVQPWDAGVVTGASFAIRDIAYANGVYIAVAQPAYDSAGLIFKSTDNVIWRKCAVPADVAYPINQLFGIATDGAGTWVAVGVSSGPTTCIFSSTDDGETWVRRTAAVAGLNLTGVEWAGGTINKFFSCSGTSSDKVQHSPDGETWSQSTLSGAKSWQCVAYSEDLDQVLLGAGDGSIETFDGATWTAQTSDVGQIQAAVWATSPVDLWVTVGTNTIQTSPDGVTWTQQANPAGDHSSLTIAFAPGIPLLVAGGVGSNNVIYSADGITWLGDSEIVIFSITYSADDGYFVAGFGANTYFSASYSGWNRLASSISGFARGQVRTEAADHEINSVAQEAFYFPPAHYVDTLLLLLEGTGRGGLGIDASEIDTVGLAAIKAATPTHLAEWLVLAEANGTTWIQEEINFPFGLYPKLTGKIGMHRAIPADVGDVVASLTHKNMIFSGRTERPILTWDESVAPIYNAIVWQYDYDAVAGRFLATKEFTDDDSIERFGRKPLTIPSKGLRSELGAVGIITELSAIIFARWATPAPTVTMRTHLQKHTLEPGDLVEVTSPLLPNRGAGTRGITAGLMEIVNRGIVPSGADGEVGVNFTLLDFSS